MKKTYIILFLIIVLAAMFRLMKLDKIPSGFVPEEVSSAWDAYSLVQTGKDEWGKFLPLIFSETGGFKLALPSYLMIPGIKILGLNEFAVRLPTALAGILSVFLTYLLSLEFFKNKKIALSAAFFLAVSPWHVSMSRYAEGVNWGILLFLTGLLFFLKSKEKPILLVISGIFIGFTYHTYFNYLVFNLLFVIFFLFSRRHLIKTKSGLRILAFFLLTQLIFLFPFFSGGSVMTRFSQATSIGNIGFVNKIDEHRQACNASYPQIFCKMIYNKPIEKITELSKNLISHYSTTIFFLYGSELGLSAMPKNWGYLYLFEFPLILLGFGLMVRKKMLPAMLVFWAIIYPVPSSLAGEAHIWRMMTILPLPQIMAAVGLVYLFSLLKNNLLRIGVVAVICFSILRFVTDYFVYMPFAQGSYSYFGFRDLYRYLATVESDYENIVIAPTGMGFNQLYIYYLFYTKADPEKFQSGEDVDRVVGEQDWVWVNRIGKWYFVSEPQKVKYPLSEKTLLVTDNIKPDELLYDTSLRGELLHTIYHANGDVAFKILNLRLRPVE